MGRGKAEAQLCLEREGAVQSIKQLISLQGAEEWNELSGA